MLPLAVVTPGVDPLDLYLDVVGGQVLAELGETCVVRKADREPPATLGSPSFEDGPVGQGDPLNEALGYPST